MEENREKSSNPKTDWHDDSLAYLRQKKSIAPCILSEFKTVAPRLKEFLFVFTNSWFWAISEWRYC
jgi:hypothetical protein